MQMLEVGKTVKTVFSGKLTQHTVVAMRNDAKYSASGVQVQVKPALKDLLLSDWIDVRWFTSTPAQQL